MSLENYIENEVKEKNIVMFYQKIIAMNNNCNCYECLSRMKNNITMSPLVFLPIIIKLNMYEEFTKTIIEKSFKKFKDKKILFSINLTYRDFLNENILQFLEKQLKETNLGKYLIIEILEDEIKDFSVVNNFINKLKPYGVQFAIDDFGKNYSNLTHLLYLKPNFLKIDIFLIKEFDKNYRAKIIVETVVDLAKQLNIKVIAEGVEDKKTFQALLKYKIDAYQGFYFSKPNEELE
jgi:EAL domain-containing protein (putative c-di-GMP-specific phosphodiesterase class I)